jgi:transposase
MVLRMRYRSFSLLEATPQLVAHLLSQVKILPDEPDSCWLWVGALNHNGYGYFNYRKRQWLVHRTLYYILNQKDPNDLLICHTCDVRSCCNPRHWFPGTHKDNQQDMARKGRAASGDRHPSKIHPERLVRGERSHYAILKEQDVLKIREMYASENYSQPQLAKLFNVCLGTVHNIIRNRSWTHLSSPTSILQCGLRVKSLRSKGTANAMAKLTEDQVRQIKHLLAGGSTTSSIATQFKVKRETVYSIKKGYNWSHVTP